MEVNKTLIKGMGVEDCVSMLNIINDELHNYNRTSPEQLQNIVNLCAMVREQLNYLHLKEKDSGRFISKITRKKIDALDISARTELANKLSGAIDFESICIVEYINKINYEQSE